VCDLQERFRTLITGFPAVVESTRVLIEACRLHKIPIVVTEQYPKAFGATVPELGLDRERDLFVSKTQFSVLVPEVKEFLDRLCPEHVFLTGIETHVCIIQSAVDLQECGFRVHLPCDTVSSQRLYDRSVALEAMRSRGIEMTTVESLVFKFMRSSLDPEFKATSAILKNRKISPDFPIFGSGL